VQEKKVHKVIISPIDYQLVNYNIAITSIGQYYINRVSKVFMLIVKSLKFPLVGVAMVYQSKAPIYICLGPLRSEGRILMLRNTAASYKCYFIKL
jgi:hypothetical protein